jgi:hypothetical protein
VTPARHSQAFPVPSLATQIEADWAAELAAHFERNADEVLARVRPWFGFPPGRLRVELMDGSAVEFSHAFHIVNETRRTIAVFTEHCGHHLYPNHEARICRDGELVYEQRS